MNEPLLNSQYLFHFTKRETIPKILSTGFRYSILNEKLIDESNRQAIFGICFSDLPFQDSKYHRSCYGNYGLVLTKNWGVNNGISPVRYVHKNSPGTSVKYLNIKKGLEILKRHYHESNDIDFPILYLFLLLAYHDKSSNQIDLKRLDDPNFEKDFIEERQAFIEFNEFLINNFPDYANLFTKYIELLHYRITELHNELLFRDKYLRNYSEDFICPNNEKRVKNKCLYNEREWRALERIAVARDSGEQRIKEIQQYHKNGFLPIEYNLTFSTDDIECILIEKDEDKDFIISQIHDDSIVKKDEIIEKFMLNDDFDEKATTHNSGS